MWRQILPEVLTQARSLKVVDLRHLHDESQGVLSAHVGRHPGIISQLLASRAGRFYLNDEYNHPRAHPAWRKTLSSRVLRQQPTQVCGVCDLCGRSVLSDAGDGDPSGHLRGWQSAHHALWRQV